MAASTSSSERSVSASAGGAWARQRSAAGRRSGAEVGQQPLPGLELVELGAGEVELGLLVERLLVLEVEVGDVARLVLALRQLGRRPRPPR